MEDPAEECIRLDKLVALTRKLVREYVHREKRISRKTHMMYAPVEEILDSEVTGCKENEAADINNRGLIDQVAYLMEYHGAAAEKVIKEIFGKEKK